MNPARHASDVKAASPRSQTKAAPCLELRSRRLCRKRRRHHSPEEVSSSWTGSARDISTYITSRDLTSTCTRTGRLLVLGKREKLGNAALRENYRHDGAITEIIELVGPTVTVALETAGPVAAHLWAPEAQKDLKVDRGRTLGASTEWTSRNMEELWRAWLKKSQASVPVRFIFVADFKTLMLSNVYIAHECLPALMAQIRLGVSLRSECCEGSRHPCRPRTRVVES